MPTLSRWLLVSALIACLVPLSACGGGASSAPGTAPATGKLNILVTDAPFPYDFVASASIVIDEIRVRDAAAPEDQGWTTVFTGPVIVDLVPLQNGAVLPLVEADLQPGTYDTVRVIVSAGEVVLGPQAFSEGNDPLYSAANGRLKFPSASTSGLKVKIEGDIVVSTTLSSDLLLDFDLSRNFVFNGPATHAPGVKGVIFTPVVRATNVSTAGSLQVTALSDALTPLDSSDDAPISGASVELYADGEIGAGVPVATAGTAADGIALLAGLAPGTYDVHVTAPGHQPAEVQDVVVVLANLASASVTLAASGEVSGDVMTDSGTPDVADDLALAGVTIQVAEDGTALLVAEVTTDANGAFQVSGLAPGFYDVTITKPGFVPQTVQDVPATMVGGQVHAVLSALLADLRVTVSQALSAVAGATVVITDPLGTEIFNGLTDALGQVTAAALPTAQYSVAVTLPDTSVQSVLVDVLGTDPLSTQDASVDFP